MNEFLKIAFVAVFILVAVSVLWWLLKTIVATVFALVIPAAVLIGGGYIGYKIFSRRRALNGRGRIVR